MIDQGKEPVDGKTWERDNVLDGTGLERVQSGVEGTSVSWERRYLMLWGKTGGKNNDVEQFGGIGQEVEGVPAQWSLAPFFQWFRRQILCWKDRELR